MSASTHLRIVGSEALLGALPAQAAPRRPCLVFDAVYREHFAFVWRAAKRLGVGDGSLDDVVQEVFVVVHRRLGDFEGRSSVKTWLFGIALRIVRDHRRAARRRPVEPAVDVDTLESTASGPAEHAEKAEAVRVLHTLLDQLADERREVFVMADLEQLTMPEIAETLAINVNTAYARLRLARQEFEQALARHRARDGRRPLQGGLR
jgi:RNA polymerase sigma-70 factor (ECF subfamily)